MFTEMMFVKYSNEKSRYVGVRRNVFSWIGVVLPCYSGGRLFMLGVIVLSCILSQNRMEEQGRWQVSYKIECTVENTVSIEFTLA